MIGLPFLVVALGAVPTEQSSASIGCALASAKAVAALYDQLGAEALLERGIAQRFEKAECLRFAPSLPGYYVVFKPRTSSMSRHGSFVFEVDEAWTQAQLREGLPCVPGDSVCD